MALALFDLDNTLLAGDSDYLWGRFLAEQGVVDPIQHEEENRRFFEAYREGKLDIDAFLRFSLRPLKEIPPQQLLALRDRYLEERIKPLISDSAQQLVDSHRRAGDTLLIITATNRFVTEPIAALLGIEHLIATEPEQVDGRYTGAVEGTPSFQEGKVVRLKAWLKSHPESLSGSIFYSDSHNDLPLLEWVERAVAVNPDETLEKVARTRGWEILNLHAASE